MNEKYYEQLLRRRVEQLGAMCLKLECPGYAGVPDRIILIPGGRAIFVETKRPGKTERPRQRYVQDRLRELGFKVFSSVDSREKIEAVVNACKRQMEKMICKNRV